MSWTSDNIASYDKHDTHDNPMTNSGFQQYHSRLGISYEQGQMIGSASVGEDARALAGQRSTGSIKGPN